MHQAFSMHVHEPIHELGSRAWFTSLVNELAHEPIHEPIHEPVYELTSRV